MNWFDAAINQKAIDESNSFRKVYSDLIVNLLVSAYITANFLYKQNGFQKQVPYTKIFNFYLNPNKTQDFKDEVHIYSFLIEDAIKNMLFYGSKKLGQFTGSIVNHFSTKASALILFAHVTFPSLFSFYTFPDTIVYAVCILKLLLPLNCPNISCHFISSFYESYPNFLVSLFNKYDELTFKLDKRQTPITCFHNLILAIEHASNFLTDEHFSIAKNCYAQGKDFFAKVFIKTLMIPQLKIRNYNQILIDSLNFISTNAKAPSFVKFCKAFTTPHFTRPTNISIYGGYCFFHQHMEIQSTLNWVPFYATAYEILLLYKIILPFSDPCYLEQYEYPFNEIQSRGLMDTIYLMRIYPRIVSKNKKYVLKDMYKNGFLFPQEYISKNVIKDEYFKINFDYFLLQATKEINNPVEYFHNLFSIQDIAKNNKNFQIYTWNKIIKRYIKKFNDYDVLLSLIDCKHSISNQIEAAKENILELMSYVSKAWNESDNEIQKLINFWKILNNSDEIPLHIIFNELANNFVNVNPSNNNNKLHENEIKKLQIYMKSILLTNNKKIIITKIPKFFIALKKRFHNLSNDELDNALYNSIVTIVNDCKIEFIKYFCYYFKYIFGMVENIIIPNEISINWVNIFNLITKFVFATNKLIMKNFSLYLVEPT